MNPALQLYQAWWAMLDLPTSSVPPRSAECVIGHDQVIYHNRATDPWGRPIIHLGRSSRWGGDFSIRSDGAFTINYYDNDLKRTCRHTFLGWDWVPGSRVVFVSPRRGSWLDYKDHEDPVPYFRWNWCPPGTTHETLLHLVPDSDRWRVAVHPESKDYAARARALDHEYDVAARRYRRHQRAREPRPTEDPVARQQRLQPTIEMVSMLIEPYTPTMRPKEEALDHRLDAGTKPVTQELAARQR